MSESQNEGQSPHDGPLSALFGPFRRPRGSTHTGQFEVERTTPGTVPVNTVHVRVMSRTKPLNVKPAARLNVPTIELPMLVDKHAIAEYFGVSVRTVEDWRYNNIGPKPVKVGGTLRWRAEDILKFVEDSSNA